MPDSHTESFEDIAPSPLEAATRTEAMKLLMDFLAKIDEAKREVFLLTEIEQLTAPEIAAHLSVPLNTVYSRLRAARHEFEEAVARAQRRIG